MGNTELFIAADVGGVRLKRPAAGADVDPAVLARVVDGLGAAVTAVNAERVRPMLPAGRIAQPPLALRAAHTAVLAFAPVVRPDLSKDSLILALDLEVRLQIDGSSNERLRSVFR